MPTDITLTLAQARAVYLASSGLDERCYRKPVDRVRFGPLRLWFPNLAARRRAVRLHDLHHALTGYTTSWRGEGAIGAWEIAGGCGAHGMAWLLVLAAVGLAAITQPIGALRAYQRGRGFGNLLTDFPRGETPELLAMTVVEARARYGLDRPPRPLDMAGLILFQAWAAVGIAAMLLVAASFVVLAIVQWPAVVIRGALRWGIRSLPRATWSKSGRSQRSSHPCTRRS